ncbi:RHS repeat domain-containing protein, partial [Treponema pedis]
SRYKELGKKVPQAYRVYVEETFLPCDAGDARIFSKEMTHTDNQGDNDEQREKRYYYHSDHLGSAQFVTDWRGRQYEHIEYTPYGELWVEETAPGIDKLPFRFTGKELDEETGLYYYGARYLDPKYSRWLSGDPALNDYMAGSSVGQGGIYNIFNFNLYNYANNNPIKYIDPDGLSPSDLEAAYMANDVYAYAAGKKNEKDLPGGWERESIEYLSNGNKGGAIGVYSRVVDGKKEYTLANKGTDPLFMADWRENISQPFGKSGDMMASIDFAKEFVKDYSDSDITFTGHSKGGAEAAANAIATGKNAVIFNPATVNLASYGLSLKNYKGNMSAYIVRGEILNNIFGGLSKPIDKKIMLPIPWSSVGFNLLLGRRNIISSINNHSMSSVIKGMEWKGIK